MSAAINPYSIAVAPRLSAPSLRKIVRIAITPPSSGPRPRGRFIRIWVNNSCSRLKLTPRHHSSCGCAGVHAAKCRISNVSTVRSPSPASAKASARPRLAPVSIRYRGTGARGCWSRPSLEDRRRAGQASDTRPARDRHRRPASTKPGDAPAAERAPRLRSADGHGALRRPRRASAARIAARSWGTCRRPRRRQ